MSSAGAFRVSMAVGCGLEKGERTTCDSCTNTSPHQKRRGREGEGEGEGRGREEDRRDSQ